MKKTILYMLLMVLTIGITQAVSIDNIVAYYEFNDRTDYYGNLDLDETSVSYGAYENCARGSCANLTTALSSYLNGTGLIENDDTWSFNGWVYWVSNSEGVNGVIYSTGDGTENGEERLYIEQDEDVTEGRNTDTTVTGTDYAPQYRSVMLTVIRNGTDIKLCKNATTCTNNSRSTNAISTKIFLGKLNWANQWGVKGLFDEFLFTSDVLNDLEIQGLYNNLGSPFNYSSLMTVISTPLNDSNINSTTNIYYQVLYTNNDVECSLYRNDSLIVTNYGLSEANHNFSFNSTYWYSGYNEINITCNESTNFSSDIIHLYVDSSLPTIKFINYSHDTTHTAISGLVIEDYFKFNISTKTEDINNYLVNITVFQNDTRDVVSSSQTTSIPDNYTYNISLNLYGNTNGVYGVNVTSKDAHTKHALDFNKELIEKDYTGNNIIGKTIDDKIKIYSNSSINKFTLEQDYDRKKFNLAFTKKVKYFSMYIEAEHSIDYVQDKYGYYGHFVLDNKYWYDLENSDNVEIVSVTEIKPNKYEIKLRKPSNDNDITFNSIGIINTISQTVYFDYAYFELNITIKDEIDDSIINDTNVSIYFSTSTTGFNVTTDDGNISLPLSGYDNYIVRYVAEGYPLRQRVFVHDGINTPSITLYLANYSSTIDSRFKVYDEFGETVSNARIDIEKYFVSSGKFGTVLSTITNINGEATSALVPETELYRWVVYYNNVLVWNNSIPTGSPVSASDDTYIININLGGDPYELHDILETVNGNIVVDNVNLSGNYTFNFISSTARSLCLRVTNLSSTPNDVLYLSCTTATLGSIFYHIDATTKTTFKAEGLLNYEGSYYYIDSETNTFIIDSTYKIGDKNRGYDGLFIAIIVFILAFFLFLKLPELAVGALEVSFIILLWSGVIVVSPLVKMSLAIGSLVLTIIIIAIVHQGGKNVG